MKIFHYILLLITFTCSLFCEWDIKTEWQYNKTISAVALHPIDNLIIVTESKNIHFLYTSSGSITKTVPFNNFSIIDVQYSDDGSKLAFQSQNNVGLLDAGTFEIIMNHNLNKVTKIHYISEKNLLLASGRKIMKLFNTETQEVIKEFDENFFLKPYNPEIDSLVNVNNVRYSKSTNRIIFTTDIHNGYKAPINLTHSYKVFVIDISGNILYSEKINRIAGLALSNSGNTLAYFNSDGSLIQLLDMQSLSVIGTAEGASHPLNLQFTYDDKFLFSGYFISGLNIYNMDEKKSSKVSNVGGFNNFKNPKNYLNELYLCSSATFYKFKITAPTDIAFTETYDDYKLIYSSEMFKIESEQQVTNLQIYSINGEQVQAESIGVNEYNIYNLTSGVYFISFDLQGMHITRKIMKY